MFNNYSIELLAATSSTKIGQEIEVVEGLIETSNQYGFMTVFSVISLLIIMVFFVAWQRSINKRQISELNILEKERENSLEQTNRMYDIVVNVQTQQVVQLQTMTDTLKLLNDKTVENRDKLADIDMTVHHMDDSIKTIVNKDDSILKALSEILTYVKTNDSNNKEILDKVNKIDDYFKHNFNNEKS